MGAPGIQVGRRENDSRRLRSAFHAGAGGSVARARRARVLEATLDDICDGREVDYVGERRLPSVRFPRVCSSRLDPTEEGVEAEVVDALEDARDQEGCAERAAQGDACE